VGRLGERQLADRLARRDHRVGADDRLDHGRFLPVALLACAGLVGDKAAPRSLGNKSARQRR
jgi:hypothetical protein